MKRYVKNIVFQGFILLLVTQTLNLSINSVDFYNNQSICATTVDTDYIDSILEYVIENVIGFSKDTIHDKTSMDNASKQQQGAFHIDLKWFPNETVISYNSEDASLVTQIVPRNERLVNLYYKEVPAKPPQI